VRCDDGNEDVVEDTLDQLAEAAAVAFRAAGLFVGESDAVLEGAPLRIIDGVLYRAERIPLQVEEYI
jgi:hypothetical protein